MTTQTTNTNLVGKEPLPTTWLQRIGLFILFLVCEAAFFIFGSYYLEVFPTNKNLAFNLAVSAVFLSVSLWFKFDKRLNQYWLVAFASR